MGAATAHLKPCFHRCIPIALWVELHRGGDHARGPHTSMAN
ncbi:hypothetical protein LINGRAHAP2_LOCUS26139 [Linum grandiflorum]